MEAPPTKTPFQHEIHHPFVCTPQQLCHVSVVSFSDDEAYIEVFDDFSGTKDQLYLKANRWMVQTFNNAESVIQHNDKEEGVIIGKYLMYGELTHGMYGGNDTRVFAIIDIHMKENKARLEIKPQGSWRYDGSGMTIYNFSKADAVSSINRLSQSFHDAMIQSAVDF